MAVYGYARVSTAKQADGGESLAIQQRQITGHAMMHDLTVDAFFVEEGVSGSVPIQDRPQGGLLFERLEAGDIIIASKLDRMFRSALDALQVVEQFKARGVHLHLLDLGGDIAGNGLSKLFLTIAAAFAEAERDRIRERVANSKADQKARGRYLGGAVPYGFKLTEAGHVVEDDAEQETIQLMFQLKVEGKSLREIAAIASARGREVSYATVKRALDRRAT